MIPMSDGTPHFRRRPRKRSWRHLAQQQDFIYGSLMCHVDHLPPGDLIPGYLRLSPAISRISCPHALPAISGYLRLSPAISGYLRLSPAISGYLRLSCSQLSPAISGYLPAIFRLSSGYLPDILQIFPFILGDFRPASG